MGIEIKRFIGFYDSWGFRIWYCMSQLLEIKGFKGGNDEVGVERRKEEEFKFCFMFQENELEMGNGKNEYFSFF
jgi:hypothetical protein